MRKIARLASLLAILLLPFQADGSEWHSSVGLELFSWHEYDVNERELLNEIGPRLFIEFDTRKEYSNRWNGTFRSRFYGASVKYDGETQSGVPLTTQTLYAGYLLETMLNYRISREAEAPKKERAWFIAAGVGYESWVRGIQDTSSASGYNEYYQLPYTKLGLLYSANQRTNIQFGAKLPLLVKERVGFSRFSAEDTGERFADLNLEPQTNLTLYASVDYQLADRANLSFYYDRYLFSASPSVPLLTASGNPVYSYDCDADVYTDYCATDNGSNPILAHQPKSYQQTIGIRFNASY